MQMMLTRNAAFTKNKQSVELKCYVFMAKIQQVPKQQ